MDMILNNEQMQKVLEYGKNNLSVSLKSFLQNDLDLGSNEKLKAIDYLIHEDLFVLGSNRESYRISPLGMKILRVHGTWKKYSNHLEEKRKYEDKKEKMEFKKLKWTTRVAKFQAITFWLPLAASLISLYITLSEKYNWNLF